MRQDRQQGTKPVAMPPKRAMLDAELRPDGYNIGINEGAPPGDRGWRGFAGEENQGRSPIQSVEQLEQGSCRKDPGDAVLFQGQQAAFVAGHEVSGARRLRGGEQEVIVRVG